MLPKVTNIETLKGINILKDPLSLKLPAIVAVLCFLSACGGSNNNSTQEPPPPVQVSDPTLAFVTTWDTTREGVSEDNQIMIDTLGDGFNYRIDWGDGTIEDNVRGDIVHSYAVPGSYTVTISGDFPHFYMAEITESDSGEKTYFSDNLKIQTIEQWGDVNRKSMHASFRQTFITINATDTPDLSGVTDMSYMFQGAFLLDEFDEAIDLDDWDTSAVVNMSHLFNGALPESFGLSEIVGFDKWNVDNVTDMSFMFANNEYANFNLNAWNLSNVINMQGMFSSIVYFGVTFDQWDTSSVTNMSNMFRGSGRYSLPGRSSVAQWDVSNVTTMASMFQSADNFNDDISSWNVTNVADMSDMFHLSATLTTERYDALLLSWSMLQLKNDVHFHAGYSKYSAIGDAARQNLVEQFNWVISDGGQAE